MKAKKYRLQTVLNVRARVKEEAARQIAVRYEQLAQAEDELKKRRDNLRTCREKQIETHGVLNAELEIGVQANSVVSHHSFLKDLRERETELKFAVEEQKAAVKHAEQEVEKAQQKLVEAEKELKAVEKHKENRQSEELLEVSRRERKTGDEIGAILHGRRENTWFSEVNCYCSANGVDIIIEKIKNYLNEIC